MKIKNSAQKKAKVLPCNEENLQLAAQALKEGQLISFPTETVYGLGANALNVESCLNIFETKGRPLTDPLIVHVYDMAAAMPLIEQKDEIVTKLFETLGNHYWPGPLTIVVKANLDIIPAMITAQTGYVGIRVPAHEVARQLLKVSGLPVAAPSANKFGHVSPTTAEHVFHDFEHDEVTILDGGHCSFGIESTVIKISKEETGYQLLVIRKGGVSFTDLTQLIKQLDLEKDLTIKELKRDHSKVETQQLEAPGQFLRHYSPDIDSFLYKGQALHDNNVVLLDFGQTFVARKSEVKHYRDLSEKGDVVEAIHAVYDALRWAETLEDVSFCLITHLIECKPATLQSAEHLDSLFDRVFRATSGKEYRF